MAIIEGGKAAMRGTDARELLFVLGGARSGKSSFAQRYAETHYASRLFLATAQILDDEMAERVRRHKEARGPKWDVLEEPFELPAALRSHPIPGQVVLVDCLTLWLSNILLEKGEDQARFYEEDLLKALSIRQGPVILVSNEVGLGIVPENPLGRIFRDLAGRLNQRVASAADHVVFMAAGIPWVLKGDV
jgi:adenosylcobinamide kinase/adenosylcobinamide-phosphate guanylyltransferase